MLAFPSLRDRLAGSRVATGVFCELPCPEAVEIAGLAGWDFVLIDGEHAPITASLWPSMVRAAGAAGIPSVIRVPSNDVVPIQHALDAGTSGVQIPQIASPEAARAAIEAARFHPLGRRGFNPFVRAAGFSEQPVGTFIEHANHDVALILQIESAAGVEAVDAILELKGIDVLFVGPYDLSQSLGIPGQTSHPRVYAAGEKIVQAAGRAGVAVGVFSNSHDDALHWRGLGVRYLVYSVDTVLLLRTMRETRASLTA